MLPEARPDPTLPPGVPAAVIVPIVDLVDPTVLLTKRTELVRDHKGEISFPGGAHDPSDPDLSYTALREAYEEVGIQPEDVEVLGELDEFLTISNFRVAPFVGAILKSPYTWVAHNDEVAVVLEVPVSHLLASESYAEEPRIYNGVKYNHITYQFEDHVVWGATAFMLHQFLQMLRDRRISG